MTSRRFCNFMVRLFQLLLALITLIVLEDRFGNLSASAQISTLSAPYTTSSGITFCYPSGWEVNELSDLAILHTSVEGTEGLIVSSKISGPPQEAWALVVDYVKANSERPAFFPRSSDTYEFDGRQITESELYNRIEGTVLKLYTVSFRDGGSGVLGAYFQDVTVAQNQSSLFADIARTLSHADIAAAECDDSGLTNEPLFADDFGADSENVLRSFEDQATVRDGTYTVDYSERRGGSLVIGPYVGESLIEMRGPMALSFDLLPVMYGPDDHIMFYLHANPNEANYVLTVKLYFDGRYEVTRPRSFMYSGILRSGQLAVPFPIQSTKQRIRLEVTRYGYNLLIDDKLAMQTPRLLPFLGRVGIGWSKETRSVLNLSIDNVLIEALPTTETPDDMGMPRLFSDDAPQTLFETTLQDGDVWFSESFNDNSQGWKANYDVNLVSEIQRGRYNLFMAFSDSRFGTNYIDHIVTLDNRSIASRFHEPYEFSFDVIGQLSNTSDMCLLIVFDANSGYNYKVISYCPTHGLAMLFQGRQRIASTTAPMVFNPFIVDEPLRFSLIVDEDAYTLLVGERAIATFDSLGDISGSVGFGIARSSDDVEGAAQIEVDNAVVRALAAPSAPLTTLTQADLTESYAVGPGNRIFVRYPQGWQIIGAEARPWNFVSSEYAYEVNLVNDRRIALTDSRPELTPGVANQVAIAVYEPVYVIEAALLPDPLVASLPEMLEAFVSNRYGEAIWRGFQKPIQLDTEREAVVAVETQSSVDVAWIALRNADKTTTIVEVQASSGQLDLFMPSVVTILESFEITAPPHDLDAPEQAIQNFFNLVAQGRLQTAIWSSCSGVVLLDFATNAILDSLTEEVDTPLFLFLNEQDWGGGANIQIDDRFRYYETVTNNLESGRALVRVGGIVNVFVDDEFIGARPHSAYYTSDFTNEPESRQRSANRAFSYFERPVVTASRGTSGWQQCTMP
ncbi:hypothetical protein GC175_29090 [bacterium]|nr:hypothetical protein [bacterium]